MDDKYKPYKTLKELCKEAGLQPIPFIPVAKRIYHEDEPKTERKLRRPPHNLACVCGWVGKKNQLELKTDGRVHCPNCGGSVGRVAALPSSGSV